MPTNRLVVKEQINTYTRVLFDAANKASGVEGVLEVRDQAKKIVAAIRENVDLQEALKSTTYSPEQRNTIARNVFSGANPALVDVLAVMAERGDIDYLSRVVDGIDDLLASELNTMVVDVTTVVPLDDHLRELITKKAESELGKSVVLNEHIDKSLIGGVVLSTNNERIDASVLSQVENARNVLKES